LPYAIGGGKFGSTYVFSVYVPKTQRPRNPAERVSGTPELRPASEVFVCIERFLEGLTDSKTHQAFGSNAHLFVGGGEQRR
jgi:hypothetical protein